MGLISIGNDPGYRNYGYTVLELCRRRKKIVVHVHELGMITTPITNLTNAELKPPRSKRRKRVVVPNEAAYPVQLAEFASAMDDIFDAYPTARVWTAERFQTRGIKGKSIECVTTMNAVGCLGAAQRGIAYELITASTWKNTLNRVTTLTEWYGRGLTDHTVDSFFIALWAGLKRTGYTWNDVDWSSVDAQLRPALER